MDLATVDVLEEPAYNPGCTIGTLNKTSIQIGRPKARPHVFLGQTRVPIFDFGVANMAAGIV
jgi:hypothetical protein